MDKLAIAQRYAELSQESDKLKHKIGTLERECYEIYVRLEELRGELSKSVGKNIPTCIYNLGDGNALVIHYLGNEDETVTITVSKIIG